MSFSSPAAGPSERSSTVGSVVLALMTVGRLMRQHAAGEVLDPGSIWLLKSLHSRGNMRIRELADCVNLDASTVSRHVAQLTGLGLVERTPDPDDGRASLLAITADGGAQLEQAFERRRALLAQCLDAWPEDDLSQLDQLLTRFVSDVESFHPTQENP